MRWGETAPGRRIKAKDPDAVRRVTLLRRTSIHRRSDSLGDSAPSSSNFPFVHCLNQPPSPLSLPCQLPTYPLHVPPSLGFFLAPRGLQRFYRRLLLGTDPSLSPDSGGGSSPALPTSPSISRRPTRFRLYHNSFLANGELNSCLRIPPSLLRRNFIIDQRFFPHQAISALTPSTFVSNSGEFVW